MAEGFLHLPVLPPTASDRMAFTVLPASARKVLRVVQTAGPLTHGQLHEHTGIPARTIRHAVKRLREDGFLETKCSLQDCRRCLFFATARCVGVGPDGEAPVSPLRAA